MPNLWGAVVGRPGVLKSPAIREALRPIACLEQTAAEAYAAAVNEHRPEAVVREAEKSVRLSPMKKSLKEGNRDAALALASASDEALPVRRRRMVNDATVEKLGEILRDNPRGVLVFRDELADFLRSMEREGREADRAFYLEAWQGDGRFSYDRIGRPDSQVIVARIFFLPIEEQVGHRLNGEIAPAERNKLFPDQQPPA